LTHKLESAWFQPLNLKCYILVSNFAFLTFSFKCNLHRYIQAVIEDTVVSTATSAAALAAHYAGSEDGNNQNSNGPFALPPVPIDPAEEEEVRLARYKKPGDEVPFPSSSSSSGDEDEDDEGGSDEDEDFESGLEDIDDAPLRTKLKGLNAIDGLVGLYSR
jgi:hypothetical protein